MREKREGANIWQVAKAEALANKVREHWKSKPGGERVKVWIEAQPHLVEAHRGNVLYCVRTNLVNGVPK
jgi:hypothetical protein